MIPFAPENEPDVISLTAQIGEACDRLGMPYIAEAEFPNAYYDSGDDYAKEWGLPYLKRSARLCAELGADIVKSNWPGSARGIRRDRRLRLGSGRRRRGLARIRPRPAAEGRRGTRGRRRSGARSAATSSSTTIRQRSPRPSRPWSAARRHRRRPWRATSRKGLAYEGSGPQRRMGSPPGVTVDPEHEKRKWAVNANLVYRNPEATLETREDPSDPRPAGDDPQGRRLRHLRLGRPHVRNRRRGLHVPALSPRDAGGDRPRVRGQGRRRRQRGPRVRGRGPGLGGGDPVVRRVRRLSRRLLEPVPAHRGPRVHDRRRLRRVRDRQCQVLLVPERRPRALRGRENGPRGRLDDRAGERLLRGHVHPRRRLPPGPRGGSVRRWPDRPRRRRPREGGWRLEDLLLRAARRASRAGGKARSHPRRRSDEDRTPPSSSPRRRKAPGSRWRSSAPGTSPP